LVSALLVLSATLGQPQVIVDPAVRSAFFERMLAPREGPAVPAPTPGDRAQQRAAEAAQFHRRGLVFAQQGAWKDAESAFRDAERRNDAVPEYKLSAAYAYIRTHKPNDAYKRYEDFYKKDPADVRALVGMIAAREEAQLYRDAVALWLRYTRMPLPEATAAEAEALLQGARELFAERYEIAENPAGGAANLATPAQELEWGLGYARELSASGIPLLADPDITSYVEQLSQRLVNHAKQFPTNYQLFVLDTAGVNATTVPGFIFVYRGLLEAAPSEAALAGVLAHEIGHSVAHHTAKKVTKNYQDEQQLTSLKASDSKLSQFLAKLLEAGNPVGAMGFSREAEGQADRLGVHIAFDAGYDPVGLTEMFQIFEQMSPSSRSAWDLLTRTHPFSIDRINAVKEYAALLPSRTFVPASAGFTAMKARLEALPPPPDATGRLLSAASAPAPPAATMATRPFAMEPTPFTGRMPETWTMSKASTQTTMFSAPKGTPEAEASVWIRLAPRAAQPMWSVLDYVGDLQAANAKLPGLQWGDIDEQRTADDRELFVMPGRWQGKTSAGAAAAYRGVFIVAEFPDYIAIGQYSAPEQFFDRLSAGFELIWTSLTYGAATPPTTEDPAAGRVAFTVQAPPFAGEMPTGWVSKVNDQGVTIIEGRPGTEPYEMTIRLAFYTKAGRSLEGVQAELQQALAELPESTLTTSDLTRTSEGRPARAMLADYRGQNVANAAVPFRQIMAIVEYQDHFAVIGYSGPTALFDKYLSAFEMVGSTLAPRR
jgi:hypothetical protein